MELAPQPTGSNGFEEMYLAVRQYEQRVYTDDEVACLPKIAWLHKYRWEWELRQRSANRLLNFLLQKNRPLNI